MQTVFDKPIGIVICSEYREILEQAIIGFEDKWQQVHDDLPDMDVFDVPTVGQIPWQCQQLADTQVYSVIIALGFIKNEAVFSNSHLVGQIESGIMRVSLDSKIPILSHVVACTQFIGNELQIEFYQQQFDMKGRQCADACQMLLENLVQLEE